MKRPFLSLILVALLLVAADPSPDPESQEQADQRQMIGTWSIARFIAKDKPGDKDTEKVPFVITKDTLTVKDTHDEVVTYTLRASTKPRQIDLVPRRLDGKTDKKVLGIYKIEGDELTLSFRKDGQPRPTKFEEPDAATIVLKRVKKDK